MTARVADRSARVRGENESLEVICHSKFQGKNICGQGRGEPAIHVT